jgi:hypothetical protein
LTATVKVSGGVIAKTENYLTDGTLASIPWPMFEIDADHQIQCIQNLNVTTRVAGSTGYKTAWLLLQPQNNLFTV